MIDEKVRKAHDDLERAESRRVSLFTVLAIIVVLVGSFALLKSYGVVGRAISVPDNLNCALSQGGATGVLPVNVLGFTLGEESTLLAPKKNFCAVGADTVSSLGQSLNLLLLGDSCAAQDDQIQFASQGKTTTFPRSCVDDNFIVVEQSNKVAYGTCEGNNARIVTIDCACSQGLCVQPGAAPAPVVAEPAVEVARPIGAADAAPGVQIPPVDVNIPDLRQQQLAGGVGGLGGAGAGQVQIPQPPIDDVVQQPGGGVVAPPAPALLSFDAPCERDEQCVTGACIGNRQRKCKPKSNTAGPCDSNPDCIDNNCIQNVCGGPVQQQAILNCVDEDAVRGGIDQQAMFKSRVTLGPREAYDDVCNSDPQKATFVQERVCVNNNPSFQEYNCARANKVCTQGACVVAGQPPAVQPAPPPPPPPAAADLCQSNADCPRSVPIKVCKRSVAGQPKACGEQGIKDAYCEAHTDCLSQTCDINAKKCAFPPGGPAAPPEPVTPLTQNLVLGSKVPTTVNSAVVQKIRFAPVFNNPQGDLTFILQTNGIKDKNNVDVKAGKFRSYLIGLHGITNTPIYWYRLNDVVTTENSDTPLAVAVPKSKFTSGQTTVLYILAGKNPEIARFADQYDVFTIKDLSVKGATLGPMAGKGGANDAMRSMPSISAHDLSNQRNDKTAFDAEKIVTDTIRDAAAGGGAKAGQTVICTELYRQGFMSYELKKASSDYSTAYLDAATMNGYHYWAKPLVRVMQRSPKVTMLVAPLGLAWGRHMVFAMGVSKKDDALGKVISDIGVPLTKELGTLLVKNNIKTEVSEETMEQLAKKHLTGLFDGSEQEVVAKLQKRMPLFFADINTYAQSQSSSSK